MDPFKITLGDISCALSDSIYAFVLYFFLESLLVVGWFLIKVGFQDLNWVQRLGYLLFFSAHEVRVCTV